LVSSRAPTGRDALRPSPPATVAGGEGSPVLRLASDRRAVGYPPKVFFFFSNRLGCLGSLLLSAAVTAILIVLLNR
jgi:hypothetical protein